LSFSYYSNKLEIYIKAQFEQIIVLL
jgi:hypothetical protein